MENVWKKTGLKPEENAGEQSSNKNEVMQPDAAGKQWDEAAQSEEGKQPDAAAQSEEGKQPEAAGKQSDEAGKQSEEAALLKSLMEQAAAQGELKIHIEITHIDSVSGDYIKCNDPAQLRRRDLKAEREELSRLTREEAKLFTLLKDLDVMRGCISYVGLAYNTDDLSDLIVNFCHRYGVSTSSHDLWTRELIHALRPFCIHILQDFKTDNIYRSLKNKFGVTVSPSSDAPSN